MKIILLHISAFFHLTEEYSMKKLNKGTNLLHQTIGFVKRKTGETKSISFLLFAVIFLSLTSLSVSMAQNHITSPKEQLGFNIGDDYQLFTYSQLEAYWQKLAEESPRMQLVNIGRTAEGRAQYMAIITAPENFQKLTRYKEISRKLALAEGLSDEEARQLAREGKAVIWIDGGLHATEVVGAHQLMELVYQMVSRNDEETRRFLKDVILLAVHANPDGMELVSNWYMRESDPKKRSTRNLPRLYHKYIGHDNNRDAYMVTQPETENMSRIMYREWFPQVMYNTHQTGPSGLVVFIPPFRDPPNYTYDPLVTISIQSLGTAMHSRLIAEGKPGSGMRSVASYSIWFNGNQRTTGYFHNQIGLLTEIKGNPTPIQLNFNPDRLLPSTDVPFPIEPRTFHFREAIDYSISMDRAVLDYASRNRETLLYNRYLMGKHNIEKGNEDHWTVHPKIVEGVKEKIKQDRQSKGAKAAPTGRRGRSFDKKYFSLFKKPENRDPRGYILPSDQADFPTVIKFVNTFIKNGVTVLRATDSFKVAGKSYPAGSIIFKTAQAFRPHILDMFEPQDYPNDFRYEGGPPIPPYDNAGYTLAFQMGIQFDRILDGFDGPFAPIEGFAKPLPGKITKEKKAKGFLLSHRYNDAAVVINRLLAKKQKLYWLTIPHSINGKTFPAGTIYIPAKSSTAKLLHDLAIELGVNFTGISKTPAGNALQIRPVRIGLWDRYGGSMQSGWTRWILEQFDFPFELVFTKTLNTGNLNKKYDVLIFVSGAIPSNSGRSFYRRGAPKPQNIPAEYRDRLGSITKEKTIPKLMDFLQKGGTVLTIGRSTNLGALAGLPLSNHIVDGFGKPLPREQYFIPSSILQVRVNNQLPIAYGLNERVDIFFNNSPVFRFKPDADKKGLTPVAWFDSDRPLRSGWAWGQDRLYGGVSIAKAQVEKGNLYLFGPEVLFRAQSHGTFKFIFNGIYLGNAKKVTL